MEEKCWQYDKTLRFNLPSYSSDCTDVDFVKLALNTECLDLHPPKIGDQLILTIISSASDVDSFRDLLIEVLADLLVKLLGDILMDDL